MTQKYIELPSQDYLQECFTYDEELGNLIWNERPLHHFNHGIRQKQAQSRWNNKFANTIAGRLHINGYIIVKIDSVPYSSHRLIWKLVTGSDPIEQIDHINCIKTDNRFLNLREATNGQNQHNVGLKSTNKSGVKGVHFDSWYGLWCAVITVNKKAIRLGRFHLKEQAIEAIMTHRKSFHNEFTNYGEHDVRN